MSALNIRRRIAPQGDQLFDRSRSLVGLFGAPPRRRRLREGAEVGGRRLVELECSRQRLDDLRGRMTVAALLNRR